MKYSTKERERRDEAIKGVLGIGRWREAIATKV